MSAARPLGIAIAGAGIAGLTAAIAFAARGFSVDIHERAARLEETGAGIQLSPNATRILDSLGVLERMASSAVEAEAVSIRSASSLRELASVPLGGQARARWKAPYLVVHRADLQAALLAQVRQSPAIRLTTASAVRGVAPRDGAISATLEDGAIVERALLIGADGVRSATRSLVDEKIVPRATGYAAWRTTIARDSALGATLAGIMPADRVTTLIHPDFHFVAYPVVGGEALNLVAVTTATETASPASLAHSLKGAAEPVQQLAKEAGSWSLWPIFEVEVPRWTAPGFALIGDAAHAMTPFAAQGAALAIEDAATLAALVSEQKENIGSALAAYERARRPRVERVAARGRFNRFAWHLPPPLSFGRDAVLRLKGPAGLAADLDWLYGYDAMAEAARSRLNAGSG